jgi:hypothetical protein
MAGRDGALADNAVRLSIAVRRLVTGDLVSRFLVGWRFAQRCFITRDFVHGHLSQ